MPLIEALAAGVPTTCSSIEPLVSLSGGAALLFEPKSVSAISDAMARVSDDADLRRGLARAGPVRAAEFTWAKAARMTLSVLLAAAGSHSLLLWPRMPEPKAIVAARTLYRRLSRRPDAALNEIPMAFLRAFTGQMLQLKVRGKPFVVNMDDVSVSASILIQREFEKRETLVVSKLLRQGDYAIDVGANIGWYTTLFAEILGSSGSILAVEPEPTNAAILRENLQLRALSCAVEVAEVALGDQAGGSNARSRRQTEG